MNVCEICNRQNEDSSLFEYHHLKPASMRKNSDVILVDHQCGDILHQIFQNYEMKTVYNNLTAILSNAKVQKWVLWVKKQPLEKRITMAKKKRKKCLKKKRFGKCTKP